MEIRDKKTHLSILTVLNSYNLKPNKNNMLKCPFHADDTASMKIYLQTNTFNCFGCGKNGDTIEFIQLKEECSKHDAILKAQDFVGLPPIPKPQQPKPKKPQEPQTPKERTEILTKIFESFRNGLNHPVSVKPKEYLKSRNLNYELLEIGYNSGQFHHRGQLNETDKQACINAGLLIPYNGSVPNANGTTYTAFAKDCIIFPLKDKAGNITNLYGRSITNNDKSKHYYLKDRSGLYPSYPNPNTTKLILTEAIIDSASLLLVPEIVNKYRVLACYGTNGLTDEHKQAIAGLKQLKEIIFYFAGDYRKQGTNIDYGMAEENLFDGSIKSLRWKTQRPQQHGGTHTAAYIYKYDNYNLLTQAIYGDYTHHSSQNAQSSELIVPTYDDNGFSTSFASDGRFNTSYTYDNVGNLLTLNRTGSIAGQMLDNFTYVYPLATQKGERTNKLLKVISPNNDQETPETANYRDVYIFDYNSIGQTITETIDGKTFYYQYNSFGLISAVFADAKYSIPLMRYYYDENNQRYCKEVYNEEGRLSKAIYYIYVGNQLKAVYERDPGEGESLKLSELPLYAATRIGTYKVADDNYLYEMTDHLGNVRAIFGKDSAGNVATYSYTDYYPFGMPLPGEQLDPNLYRYGYQGQFAEAEPETGNNFFDLRTWDSRLARWTAPDPYQQYFSPYIGMGNNPINSVDPDGGQNQDFVGWPPDSPTPDSPAGPDDGGGSNDGGGSSGNWADDYFNNDYWWLFEEDNMSGGPLEKLPTLRHYSSSFSSWEEKHSWRFANDKYYHEQWLRIIEQRKRGRMPDYKKLKAEQSAATVQSDQEMKESKQNDQWITGGDPNLAGLMFYVLQHNPTNPSGNGHVLAFDPETQVYYEVNHPYNGRINGGLNWILKFIPLGFGNGQKAIGYRWGKNDMKSFWDYGQEAGNGRIELLFSPIWLKDKQAAIEFFESNVGKKWNYNLFTNNCKDYILQGFIKGKAEMSPYMIIENLLDPFPKGWDIPYNYPPIRNPNF